MLPLAFARKLTHGGAPLQQSNLDLERLTLCKYTNTD